VQIERFDGSATEWDTFAQQNRGWTQFHAHDWRHVVESTFGHECLYLAARAMDGSLAGVLPLVRVRSRLFGHFMVSMPYLNYGGPLGNTEAVQRLSAHAINEAQTSGADLLEMRSSVELPLELDVSHRKLTVVRELPDDPDALWGQLPSKVRSQVRRPQKDGVEVRFGLDRVGDFYHVFARHMRDLGTPVMPRSFFDRIASAFPDSATLAVAYMQGRPVASGFAFRYGDEVEMTWASSLLEVRRSAPNMLIYWEMMRAAIQAGARRFNFGRCSRDSGTYRFKMQWGGQEEALYWYQHASGERASTPSPDDKAFAWGPRLWKRLPLPIAGILGPRIVKYLP
jgi:FemAB-related protein (PEP-CTERM system-associated)